jgi:hypothetical protein
MSCYIFSTTKDQKIISTSFLARRLEEQLRSQAVIVGADTFKNPGIQNPEQHTVEFGERKK